MSSAEKKTYDKNAAKAKHTFQANPEKIAQLKKAAATLKTTGGVVHKKKVVAKKPTIQTDSRVTNLLKRFNLQPLNDVSSVLFYMEDESVLQFPAPRVSTGYQAGVFVVTGTYETKTMEEIAPQLLQNMDIQQIQQLLQQAALAQKMGSSEIPNVDSFEKTA